MLGTRFGLVVHHEGAPSLLPSITLSKGGLKLSAEFKPSAEAPGEPQAEGLLHVGADGFFEIPPGRTGIWMNRDPAAGLINVSAKGESIQAITHLLSLLLKTPVTDATGTTGTYDIRMSVPFSPDGDSADWVRTFLQRMGLQIEQKKGTLDVLVVDHCERLPIPETPVGLADGSHSLRATPVAAVIVPGANVRSGMLPQPSASALPRFDIVSVKPCAPDYRPAPGGGNWSPGRITMSCRTVETFIRIAYLNYRDGHRLLVEPSQETIEGGPDWMRSDRYTITAKSEGAPGYETMAGPMLQALLEKWFQVKVRREFKEVPIYDLVVAKGGAKLQPFNNSCTPLDPATTLPAQDGTAPAPRPAGVCIDRGGVNGRNIVVNADGISIERFTQGFLSSPPMDRPVVNQTGLAGLFDFHFTFALDPNSDAPDAAPSIYSVLERQLGLKLVPDKGPREYLVIDRVERPPAN